jgi:hypothetical protein
VCLEDGTAAFGRRERERVDIEVPRLMAHIQIAAAVDRSERLEAAADIEDEGERLVLLSVLQQKIAEIAFIGTRALPDPCQ